METVLIISGDKGRQGLVLSLQDAGFRVIEELESGDGLRRVLDDAPHVVIMNESMSPMDGVELLPLLRRVTKSPIVVVGAGDEADIVQTLLQGADIYVTQPVNAKELVARTQALLRRNPAKDKYVGGASQDNPLDGAQLNNIFSRLSHTEGRLFRYFAGAWRATGSHSRARCGSLGRVWKGHLFAILHPAAPS